MYNKCKFMTSLNEAIIKSDTILNVSSKKDILQRIRIIINRSKSLSVEDKSFISKNIEEYSRNNEKNSEKEEIIKRLLAYILNKEENTKEFIREYDIIKGYILQLRDNYFENILYKVNIEREAYMNERKNKIMNILNSTRLICVEPYQSDRISQSIIDYRLKNRMINKEVSNIRKIRCFSKKKNEKDIKSVVYNEENRNFPIKKDSNPRKELHKLMQIPRKEWDYIDNENYKYYKTKKEVILGNIVQKYIFLNKKIRENQRKNMKNKKMTLMEYQSNCFKICKDELDKSTLQDINKSFITIMSNKKYVNSYNRWRRLAFKLSSYLPSDVIQIFNKF